jgi:LPS export ABC transporter permease LptG
MYFFSTINVYVIRQWIRWFGYSVFSFIGIIIFFETIELLRRISHIHTKIHITSIIKYVLYKIPSTFDDFLPVFIFTATIGCVWKLYQSKELLIMRSSGLSLRKIATGLSGGIVIGWFVYIFFITPVNCIVYSNFQQLTRELFSKNTYKDQVILSENGLWLKEIINDQHFIINPKRYDQNDGSFKEALVYCLDKEMKMIRKYYAPRLRLEKKHWHLESASILTHQKNNYLKNVFLPTDFTLDRIHQFQLSAEKIPWWDCLQFLDLLKKAGINGREYKAYWHHHLSKIFIIISMVLSSFWFITFLSPRYNTTLMLAGGILGSLGINFFFNLLYVLGKSRDYSAFFVSWLPTILFFFLTLLLVISIDYPSLSKKN